MLTDLFPDFNERRKLSLNDDMMMAAAGRAGGSSIVSVPYSALFDSANSESLSWAPAQDSDSQILQTWAGWVYRGKMGQNDALFHCVDTGAGKQFHLGFNSSDQIQAFTNSGSDCHLVTSAVYRDIGWYHIVFTYDSAQGTAANRCKLYVNGTQVTYFGTETYPTASEAEPGWSKAFTISDPLEIGVRDTGQYLDGYLSEMIYIDGTAYAATDFGEFSTDGLYWTPKSNAAIKALTFGTNGFYLDNATNAQTDASGNGNNFTNNNTVTTTTHTPTNTVCRVNALATRLQTSFAPYAWTISNGNRTFVNVSGGAGDPALSFDQYMIPGNKYHFEFDIDTVHASTWVNFAWFFSPLAYYQTTAAFLGAETDLFRMTIGKTGGGITNNAYFNNSSTTAPTNKVTTGSRVTFEVDMSTIGSTTVRYYFNGSLDTTWSSLAFSDEPYVIGFYTGTETDRNGIVTSNFDVNDFADTPTTDYIGLSTTEANEAIADRTPQTVGDHWSNTLYTGNGTAIGSGGNAISGVGFQPDFAWIKGRSGSTEHVLTDSIRGVTKELSSNDNGASETVAEGLTTFGSDGFTVGSDGSYNTNTATYVAWCAKLGGAAVTNTAGDVNSSVSVNQTLGMSVGTFTTQASAGNYTAGTGLTGTAQLYFIKRLDGTGNWYGNHVGMPNRTGYYVKLDTTAAQTASTAIWGAGPSDGLIGIKSGAIHAESAMSYMFVAFEVSEFMSIGSYEGNGNTNGTFIPTLNSLGVPIQPVWVLQKSLDSTSDWIIHDNAREGYNVDNDELAANTNSAEGTANQIDIVNGGIKNRIASDPNVSETYAYVAIGQPIISSDGLLKGAR